METSPEDNIEANEIEELEPETDETSESPEEVEARPALVINVHSWATPVAGLVMLVIGLVVGYLLYPVVAPKLYGPSEVAVLPGEVQSPTVAPAATANPADEATRQEMMDFIVSQTRHFKGNPEASVVVIEFSDFQ